MKILIATNQNLTMSSREIAELSGKRHDSVARTIVNLVEKGVIQSPQIVNFKNNNNVDARDYIFSGEQGKRDTYIVIAQVSPEFTAKIVDRWQELEAQQAPKLPTTYIEALQALLIAEQEKQHAIATKAEIGNRREATAMNTASQAVKKANALEIELDRSKDYATVKRMEMLHHGVNFDWRKLKATCADMGIEPLAVFDQNYGTVKAYHRDVWQETYALTF